VGKSALLSFPATASGSPGADFTGVHPPAIGERWLPSGYVAESPPEHGAFGPASVKNFGSRPFADPEGSAAETRPDGKTDGGKAGASAFGFVLVGFIVFALAALSASFLLLAAAIRPH
jgi:hypothetical protein